MDWLYTPVEPRQMGRVDQVEVPTTRYLSTAFAQGMHDSAFSAVSRLTERLILDDGPLLQPDEANSRFGLSGQLSWESPVRESVARAMNYRKQKEIDREFFLSEGTTGPLRWSGSFAAGVLGSVANPLDAALMFFPVVGSEKAAASATTKLERAFARGMIQSEKLSALPKFGQYFIDASVGQVVAEVPVFVANRLDQANYGLQDSVVNVVAGGALGAGFRIGLERALDGAAKLFKRLDRGTKDAAFRVGLEQAARGEEINVTPYVMLDEAAIREKVKADPELMRAEAERHADALEPGLRQKVFEKYHGEKIVSAAIRTGDGKVHTGPTHPMVANNIIEAHGLNPEQSDLTEKISDLINDLQFEDGFMTSSGRFVSRTEAEQMTGVKTGRGTSEDLLDEDKTMARAAEIQQATGKSIEEALHDARNERMGELWSQRANEAELFWDQPHVKEAVAKERERLINNRIRAMKRQAKKTEAQRLKQEVLAETERQRAQGRVLSEEDLNKYGLVSDEDGLKVLDEDIRALEEELEMKTEQPEGKSEEFVEMSDEQALMDLAERKIQELDAMEKGLHEAIKTECAGGGSTTANPNRKVKNAKDKQE